MFINRLSKDGRALRLSIIAIICSAAIPIIIEAFKYKFETKNNGISVTCDSTKNAIGDTASKIIKKDSTLILSK